MQDMPVTKHNTAKMHKRQSNLAANQSDNHLDPLQHNRLLSLVNPTTKITATRNHPKKAARQSNISLNHDLIDHYTCSDDRLKVLQVQSNVTCTKSRLFKSLHISQNQSEHVRKKSTSSTRFAGRRIVTPNAKHIDIQDDYVERGRRLGKRHILQAVENVDADEDLWYQQRDGGGKRTRGLAQRHPSSEALDRHTLRDQVYNLKRKHGSTTNARKGIPDDDYDDSLITIATKEGSLHLSDLTLEKFDSSLQEVEQRWNTTIDESEEYETPVHQADNLFIRSTKLLPPEMFSPLPYYRGNNEDSTRHDTGLEDDVQRWNWQNGSVHHVKRSSPTYLDDGNLEIDGEVRDVPLKFLCSDDETYSKRLTSTTRLSSSKPILDASKELSWWEKPSQKLLERSDALVQATFYDHNDGDDNSLNTSTITTRQRSSQPILDASKELSRWEEISTGRRQHLTGTEQELLEHSDALVDITVESKLLATFYDHTNGDGDDDDSLNATKRFKSDSPEFSGSRLTTDTRELSRSVLDTRTQIYDYDPSLLSSTGEIFSQSLENTVEKDHGESLHSHYHETLAKSHKYGRKPDRIGGSLSEFSHSVESMTFHQDDDHDHDEFAKSHKYRRKPDRNGGGFSEFSHQDDVLDLLISGNSTPLPAQNGHLMSNSWQQQSAINEVPKSYDGNVESSDLDFETIDVQSAQDDIWKSIRKVAKKIENNEALLSYNGEADEQSEAGNNRVVSFNRDLANTASANSDVVSSRSTQEIERLTSSHNVETAPSASRKLSFTDQHMSSKFHSTSNYNVKDERKMMKLEDDDFPFSSQRDHSSPVSQNSPDRLLQLSYAGTHVESQRSKPIMDIVPPELLSSASRSINSLGATTYNVPHRTKKPMKEVVSNEFQGPNSASRATHSLGATAGSLQHRTSSGLEDKQVQPHKLTLMSKSDQNQRHIEFLSSSERTLELSANERTTGSYYKNERTTKSSFGNQRTTNASTRNERTSSMSINHQNKSPLTICEPSVDFTHNKTHEVPAKLFRTSNQESEDPLNHNSTMNSSGTFRLEDLDSSVDEIYATNKTGCLKNRDDAHKVCVPVTRKVKETRTHRKASVTEGKRFTTGKKNVGGITGTGTRYSMQPKKFVEPAKREYGQVQKQKGVRLPRIATNKGHILSGIHRPTVVDGSPLSISAVNSSDRSPRRILWTFKILDLLHSTPADKQEELVAKAYWFRRWLSNVRLQRAAKQEEQTQWKRAIALHNLHLLQNAFHGWHSTIGINQEKAEQLWYMHTLEKGLKGLRWAVMQTRNVQSLLAKRRRKKQLAIHFNKWKTLSANRQLRLRLLDAIANKYVLAKMITKWKKLYAMKQKQSIATLHYKVHLLSSAFHQWQTHTARSRVEGCQDDIAKVHYEVKVTTIYWGHMKMALKKSQQAKHHFRNRLLAQVFRAWQQGCLVAKSENLHDNCQAKETRRRALVRLHLTKWRENLRVLQAKQRINQLKVRYVWELWRLRYQRQKLHRLILASKERREIKKRVLNKWVTFVQLRKERRSKAVETIQKVLMRSLMKRWKEIAARQRELRECLTNHIHSNQRTIKHHTFQHWVCYWRLTQAVKLRQRLWSERCVKKSIVTWKLFVRCRRLEKMCQHYQPIREEHLVRAAFSNWQDAFHKTRNMQERTHSAKCLLQQNNLHRILLAWRLVTIETKTISPMRQRRKHKIMASAFDNWRSVVQRKQRCVNHLSHKKHNYVKTAFAHWREKTKQQHKFHAVCKQLSYQKLQRHFAAWRQVGSRRSTVLIFQGRCEERLVEGSFRLWKGRLEERQLREEICKGNEVRSVLLKRVYFRVWYHNINWQNHQNEDVLLSFNTSRRQRALLVTFKKWKQRAKVAEFTRRMHRIQEQRTMHDILQAWDAVTKLSFQHAVQSFSLSLLEPGRLASSTSLYRIPLSSASSSLRSNHSSLGSDHSSLGSNHSSAEDIISVISYPEPIFLPDNKLSNHPPPSYIPDSGYLGNVRMSSSPSLSSGLSSNPPPVPDSGYLGNVRMSSSPSLSSGMSSNPPPVPDSGYLGNVRMSSSPSLSSGMSSNPPPVPDSGYLGNVKMSSSPSLSSGLSSNPPPVPDSGYLGNVRMSSSPSLSSGMSSNPPPVPDSGYLGNVRMSSSPSLSSGMSSNPPPVPDSGYLGNVKMSSSPSLSSGLSSNPPPVPDSGYLGNVRMSSSPSLSSGMSSNPPPVPDSGYLGNVRMSSSPSLSSGMSSNPPPVPDSGYLGNVRMSSSPSLSSGMSSNPPPVPDSGYLGNVKMSSSPSLSSGLFDLEGHVIPLQYLSQSGHSHHHDASQIEYQHHCGGFQDGQVLFSTPKKNQDVPERQLLNLSASYIGDKEDKLSEENSSVFCSTAASTEDNVVHHLEYTAMNLADDSLSDEDDDVQGGILNKRSSVMAAILRWRMWPASAAFKQWHEYTKKRNSLRALQHMGRDRVSQIQQICVWKEWRKRLETNKLAVKHRDSKQVASVFMEWRQRTLKNRHQTCMKREAEIHLHDMMVRKAFTMWRAQFITLQAEQSIQREHSLHLQQLKQDREEHERLLKNKISRNTMKECLVVWRHKTNQMRCAQVHHNRVIASRCIISWAEWTDARQKQTQKCDIFLQRRCKAMALKQWRMQLSKVQAADEHYAKSVTQHLHRTLQVWHCWVRNQQDCRVAETAVTKQRNNRVLGEMFRVWKEEKDKMAKARDIADRHCLNRSLLQWKHFVIKQHQLQESQSTLQHTVDMHLLTCAFMYWKHAHRSSRLSKDIASRREKALMVEAFNKWRNWVLTCRADRHRQRLSLRKTFNVWKRASQIRAEHKGRMRAVFHHWRARVQNSKEKHRVVCQIQQQWQRRYLQSMMGKWRDALKRSQRADEYSKMSVMKRVFKHWQQAVKINQSIHTLCTTMQTRSKHLHLKKAFRTWKTKHHYVEAINQSVVTALTLRETVRLQEAFAMWKAKFNHVEDINQRSAVSMTLQDSKLLKQAFAVWKAKFRHVEDINQRSAVSMTLKDSKMLQQAFAVWKAKLRHVEDINQRSAVVMIQRESKMVQHAFEMWYARLGHERDWSVACQQNKRFIITTSFYVWKESYTTRVAAKHNSSKTIRKHFDLWRASVRIRETELQHDEDMEKVAVLHFQQMICKRVLHCWHQEILIEKQLTLRRCKLARKYARLWQRIVAMQRTAAHMATYWQYRSVWRQWRRELMQRQAVSKVAGYNNTQICNKTLAAWHEMTTE